MDIRIQLLEALDCYQCGCAQRGRVLLKTIYNHRKEILNLGWQGFKIVNGVLLILAFPHRADAAVETIRDFLRN